jgi:hypothetical protein
MDADCQARVGRVGRSVGVPNYKNDILINVVEEYLPQGLEAWRGVAMTKPEEVVADALSLRQLNNNQLTAETVVAVMVTATATVTTTAGGGGGSSGNDTETLSTATMTVIADDGHSGLRRRRQR